MMWLLATTVAAQAQDVPAPASAPDPSAAETQALTPAEAAELKLEIEARLNQFADDFNDLYLVNNMKLSFDASGGIPESIAATLSERMKRLNASFNYLDIKWNTYYQAQQLDIAADDDLMEKATALEILKQRVKDSLDVQTRAVEAITQFAEADRFIISQVSVYKRLYSKAFRLSLVQKLAPRLEKVKAREQTVFTQLQTYYDQARTAATTVPALAPRMKVLDDQFVVMKSVSEKVQQLEYKPFVQRVKDYVLGLAGVAIILMFLNSLVSRFKAYQAKLANAKKLEEMMNKNNGGGSVYPTI